MASKRASIPAKRLFDGLTLHSHQQCLLQSRPMATHTSPESTLSETYNQAHLDSAPTEPILKDKPSPIIPTRQQRPRTSTRPSPPPQPRRNPFLTTATTTLHAFPSLEPTGAAIYPSTHLLLPLRRDILHRAVIYEGDKSRQGTASAKWRSEVHGSNRKVRPQKGTGSARLGNKKSPMLKGGGVAFPPKPRDFATGLPRRVYDLAWRTALSYRYRMGQLMVLEDTADLPADISVHSLSRYLKDMLRFHRMDNAGGRTLFVTWEPRETLWSALNGEGENMGKHARARQVDDVDVKDLLGMGRVVMERRALERIFREHEADLHPGLMLNSWREQRKAGEVSLGRLVAGEGAEAEAEALDVEEAVAENLMEAEEVREAESARAPAV